AIGVVVPENLNAAQLQSLDPVIVGVVRTTSRDAAALLAQIVDEVRQKEGAREKPVVRVVGGARVTTLHASTPKSAFSFAQVGDTLVFGTPSGVTKMLSPGARTKRLDDVPGFASASDRVPGRRQAFAFLNGAPMVRAFNEGLAQAFQPTAKRG